MSRKKAILYVIIASVLWSFGGILIKLVDWNPIAIAGGRSFVASIVMVMYLKKSKVNITKTKAYGAISYVALVILFVTSTKLTTSANAILLQFTAPIWVAIFSSIFLKEKVHMHDWITITVVFSGMILFFIGDLEVGNMFGNFTAVLSGIAMALVIIFLKLQKDGSPVEMTLLGNYLMIIVSIPFLFGIEISFNNLLGILLLGIFQLGISYIFYAIGIQYVSNIEAILIPILEPILNPIWVMLLIGELPGIYSIVGGVIILCGIVIRGIYHEKFIKNCQSKTELQKNLG